MCLLNKLHNYNNHPYKDHNKTNKQFNLLQSELHM